MTPITHRTGPASRPPVPRFPATSPQVRRSRAARTGALLALAGLLTLTACSASGADQSASADMAYQSGADGGAVAPQEVGAADGDATDGGEQSDELVVLTAHATLTAEDPVAAAGDLVTLVERLDGRVDAQYVRTGDGEDDRGNAELTVRLPSDTMATIRDDLDGIATVAEYSQSTETVTAAAQDLDARIKATELSVARMQDLLSRASTNTEIIEAEQALTDRQATLERLRSERARLADRVALSTLDVAIYPPDEAPEQESREPATFLDGLDTGWASFVGAVRGLLVVVGILLPWLVTAGLVTAGVLWWRRRRAARTTATAAPLQGGGGPGSPRPTPPPAAGS